MKDQKARDDVELAWSRVHELRLQSDEEYHKRQALQEYLGVECVKDEKGNYKIIKKNESNNQE